MKPKILIFDLDKTISVDCFRTNPFAKLNVMEIIRKANDNQHKIFIVTSRLNISEADTFNNNYDTLLNSVKSSKNIPGWKYASNDNIDKDILQLIKQNIVTVHNKNPNYPGSWFRWIVKEETDRVKKIADNITNHPNLTSRQTIKHWLHNYVKNVNITGIIKMAQITDIMNDHPHIESENIFFFDDAIHNYDALKVWRTHIDKRFRGLKFLGGKGEPVFNEYSRNQLLQMELV
jgi:hydroxymethylpyrimidine pyrophosphatase-like HAD family hydrolase